MKTISLTFAVALLSSKLLAEDAAVETTVSEAQARKEAQNKLEAEQRAKKLMDEKVVVYGGFLVDVAQADRKSKLLSLRQPANPKKDAEHLYLDERTGRPKGFVLFSLGF
jgi:hypothetical protein